MRSIAEVQVIYKCKFHKNQQSFILQPKITTFNYLIFIQIEHASRGNCAPSSFQNLNGENGE